MLFQSISTNEATSHGRNFDHLVVNQELVEEWKRHHVGSLSKNVERARGLKKSTDVCPVVRDGSGSPQWCGARWRRQGRGEIVAAATTPNGAIEITCN